MGLFKKIKKAVKKVTGNKVFKTVFPVSAIANSSAGQKIGLGIAGGLGLSSLFGAGGSLAGSALNAGSALSATTDGANEGQGFLGSIFNTVGNVLGGGSNFLGGLINTGLGTAGSYLTAQEQLRGQERLQDKAFAQSVDMWNKQNAYNTPAAQMQRYREAGLNPNLIYGNGVSSAGNASGAPNYEAPHYRGMDMSSIMAFQSMQNLEAQNELLAQQLALAKEQTRGAAADSDIKAINAGFATAFNDAKLARDRADAKYNAAVADVADKGSGVLNDRSGLFGKMMSWIGKTSYNFSSSARQNEATRRRVYRRVHGSLKGYVPQRSLF